MKVNFDIKNKKGSVEADVEKLVEKGMDNHEKDWKDKFKAKHEAKKELLELKHKNKMEMEDKKEKKMGFFKSLQEEKRKKQALELEEIRKRQQQILKNKIIASISITIVSILIIAIGYFFGTLSGDKGWYAVGLLGALLFIAIPFVWLKK